MAINCWALQGSNTYLAKLDCANFKNARARIDSLRNVPAWILYGIVGTSNGLSKIYFDVHFTDCYHKMQEKNLIYILRLVLGLSIFIKYFIKYIRCEALTRYKIFEIVVNLINFEKKNLRYLEVQFICFKKRIFFIQKYKYNFFSSRSIN